MMPNNFPPVERVYQQPQRWLKAGCFDNNICDRRSICDRISPDIRDAHLLNMHATTAGARRLRPCRDDPSPGPR